MLPAGKPCTAARRHPIGPGPVRSSPPAWDGSVHSESAERTAPPGPGQARQGEYSERVRSPSPPEPPRRARGALPITGAVLVGALTVLQARVNGQLGAQLGDAFTAAAISFGSGLVLVLAIAVALPSGRAALRRLGRGVRTGQLRWFLLIGGVAGAFNVLTQGLTVAIIGASLFTVGLVAGQTTSGLVMDRIGYSPSGVRPVTLPRVLGAALALAAVAVSLSGESAERVSIWLLVLPFAAGTTLAWQQATNGRLQMETRSPLAATVVNFAGGTAVLCVAALARVAVAGPPQAFPTEPLLYSGGAIGVAYIVLSAAITPRTGVLLFGLGSVLGLLLGAVVLDVVWPAVQPAPAWQTAVTVSMAAVGVVIAGLSQRRRRS